MAVTAASMLGRRAILCLLASLCSSEALVLVGRADLPRLQQLLLLRGGVKPSIVEKTANASANASQPSAQSNEPTPRTKPRVTFEIRDAITAALGLSAAAATQFLCNANIMAKIMGMVSVHAHVRKTVWVLFAGTLAAVLFLVVRITNPSRALVINRVLSKLVLNRESESTLPSLVLVNILGCLAAIRALPAYDLRLLWAMFSSLGVIVGTAAIKFGGRRPNLLELLDWAWDAISSSLSSSGPPSPVR